MLPLLGMMVTVLVAGKILPDADTQELPGVEMPAVTPTLQTPGKPKRKRRKKKNA